MDWIYTGGTLVRSLNTSRLRRFLSILGVVVGIAAVISTLSVIEGVQQRLYFHLDKLGSNIVFMSDRYDPYKTLSSDYLSSVDEHYKEDDDELYDIKEMDPFFQEIPKLDVLAMKDIDFLTKRFSGAIEIDPQMIHWTSVGRTGEKPVPAWIQGGTPAGANIRNMKIDQGRYICDHDIDKSERVCVLGADAAYKIFENESPLNKNITLLGVRWRIVGVLKPKGGMMYFNYDDLIIVPLTALHEETGMGIVNGLLIRASSPESALKIHKELTDEVMARLNNRDRDDFRVFSQEQLREQKMLILRTFKIMSFAIAGFSLLVSGIGIMNIMLVSVRERTREIGIWKSVGATDSDVMLYFLAESMLTCLIGGVFGVILGIFLGSQAATLIAVSIAEISEWTPVYNSSILLLAIGSASLVGLLSGIFPAYLAARLEPMEALRYE